MRTKLILTYLVILSLPVLLIFVYLFGSALPAMHLQADQINAAAARQTAANIASKFNELLATPYAMSSDILLLVELGTQQKHERAYVNYYLTLRPALVQYRNILPSSVTLNVVTENENLYKEVVFPSNSGMIKWLNDEIAGQSWYRRAIAAHGEIIIDQSAQGSLVAAQWMNARLSQKNVNVCYIEVPEFEIRNIYRYDAIAQNKRYYLLNSEGKVLSSSISDSFGRIFDELNESTDSVYEEIVHLSYSNETLRLICVVIDPYIYRQINDLQQMALYYLLLSLTLGIIAILLISHTMTRRLRMLSQSMRDFQEGRILPPAPQRASRFQDEIDDLSVRFDRLIREINQLIQEVVQVELVVREARLQALQSQINPHFLFNFMDNVRSGLLRSGDRDTAEILRKFTLLLRRSMEFSPAAALSPLRKEIEFVAMYLELQKYRYRDRLLYEIQIDEVCESARVPRFLLQPLVENAIVHGMEGVIRPCRIEVNVRETGQFIEIIVRDDGRGFEKEELNKVRRMLEGEAAEPGKYIGLHNVRDRLNLLSRAPGCLMEIQSAPGQGAAVRIQLWKDPLSKEETPCTEC